jgi:hypothetical protein
MKTMWSGWVVGTFHGYKSERVYVLSDGSTWKQQDFTDEPAYCDDPAARLLCNRKTGTIFLDVEGTTSMVRVYRGGSV